MLETAAYTDKARRDHNEDSYLLDDGLHLYVVADGVGGLSAGEVASQLVCEALQQHVAAGDDLEHAILSAHEAVAQAVIEGKGKPGMASTVVVALLKDNEWHLSWVGDSRIYVWDGELKQLSKDHSYVESLYDAGQITLEETETHPRKNVITQAIGGNRESVEVSHNRLAVKERQVLLLCSDGLSGEIDGSLMIEQLSSDEPVQAVAKNLVVAAFDAGGKDNITCAVIRVTAINDVSNSIDSPTIVYRLFDRVLNKFVDTCRSAEQEGSATITDGNVSSLAEAVFDDTTDQTSIIRVSPKAPEDIIEGTKKSRDTDANKSSYFIYVVVILIVLAAILLLK